MSSILARSLFFVSLFIFFSCNNIPTRYENDIDLKDVPSLGSSSAKVVLVVIVDDMCIYCDEFFNKAGMQIYNEYVKTGKARMFLVDLPVLGQPSFLAAEAIRCANDQGHFWDYRNYLLVGLRNTDKGTITKENIKEITSGFGLNSGRFNECLDIDKYGETIKEIPPDLNIHPDVLAVPLILINNKEIIIGNQTFSVFENAIEKYL